ncbi:MAG: hypothetical protein IT306_18320 [Chloroflexi bacterium]|nr:hypothetical protein [Chloroflexota bacterium]
MDSRDGLAVCVQVDGVPREAVNAPDIAVRQALNSVSGHPAWDRGGYGQREPIVDVGCPGRPVMTAPSVWRDGSSFVGVPRPRVSVPSPYRVWVNVLSDQRIAEVFVGYPVRLRTQAEEIYCNPPVGSTPSCEATALGAYLTAGEFNDPSLLKEALTFALNLGGLGLPLGAQLR